MTLYLYNIIHTKNAAQSAFAFECTTEGRQNSNHSAKTQ